MPLVLERVVHAWHRNDLFLYITAAVASLVLAYTGLELWAANLNIPLEYSGDALAVGSEIKGTIETGWYKFGPSLGVPYGQTYSDFPSADNLNLVWARVIGLVVPHWALAMNLYMLVCFPLAAITAVWFLRYIGVSRAISWALAVLYAIAPYHFMRGEGHLFLASYYVIPLGAGLVIAAIRREPLWGYRDDRRGFIGVWRSYTLRSVFFVAVLATDSSYYAVFFLILLAFAGLGVLVVRRSWRGFFAAVTLAAVTVVVMLINMAPDIIYRFINGVNTEGLSRAHADTEIYALKLTQLLLPLQSSRIGPLAHLRRIYDTTYPLPSEQPSLGFVAAVGFVAMLLVLVLAAISRGTGKDRWIDSNGGILPQLAAFTFVAFLFSTVGGLSTFISFLTTSLRGWNRMSIVIAIFCLGGVGILLDLLIRWVRERGRPRWLGAPAISVVVALVLVAVGYVDQTPANASGTYAATIKAYESDQSFINRVQGELPKNAAVLQVPYLPYPETLSPTGVYGSDELLPYLHSTDLKWSGGGIKGRPRADWPGLMSQYTPQQVARLAVTSGFSGILIDRAALKDKGRALQKGFTAELGTKPLVSGSKRYAFYSLTSFAPSVLGSLSKSTVKAVTTDVTNPVMPYLQPDFIESYTSNGRLTGTAVAGILNPTFQLENDLKKSRTVTVTANIVVANSVGSVTLTSPGGKSATATLVNGRATVTMVATVPSGRQTFTIVDNATPTGTVRVASISVETSTIANYLSTNKG